LVADQPLGRILDAREDSCIIVAAADQFSLLVEHSFGLVCIEIDESNHTQPITQLLLEPFRVIPRALNRA
jgi:hypothetical protein